MVANAFEQYYKRIYERTISNNQEIVNNVSDYSSDVIEVEPVCIDNTITYYFDKKDLMSIFKTFNEKVTNGEILTDEYIVTIKDLASNVDVSLNIEQICDALGDAADSCYLTWQGFKAICSESIDAAQQYYNVISLKVSTASSTITETASNIYNILSSANNSILSKVESMISFVGLDKAATNEDTVTTMDIDLGQFTGINPVASWMGGVNWSKLALNIFSIPFMVQKFVNNCIKTIVSMVGKIVGKIFSWIGSWFKKTFIDPVDYKCDGNYLEYFNIPGKANYYLNVSGCPEIGYNENSIAYESKSDNGNKSRWYSDGPVYYKLYRSNNLKHVGESTYDNYFCERYVKPVSAEKLFRILSNYFTYPTSNTNIWNWTNGPMTFGDLSELLNQLNEADLSIENKAEESLVYNGILLSYAFARIFTLVKATFVKYCMTAQSPISNKSRYYISSNSSTDWLLQDVNLNDEILSTYNPNPSNSTQGLSNVCWVAVSQLAAMWYCAGSICNQIDTEKLLGHSMSIGRLNGLELDSSNIKRTVSNVDFITALSSWDFYDVASNSFSSVNAFSNNGEIDSYLNTSNVTNSQYNYLCNFDRLGQCNPFLSNGIITFACRELQSGTEYDGAYVAYIEGFDVNFKRNVDIVTDAEHANAVGNFIKGALISAAVIVAGIAIGSTIRKVIKAYRVNSATASALSFSYGEALAKGDVATAESIYNQYRGYNLKSKLLGKVLGASSTTSGSSLANAYSKLTSTNGTEDIIKLIRQ